MIIDWYYPDDIDNFGPPHLYLRTRDKYGTLQEQHITPHDDGYVRPHCWIPTDTPNWKITRLMNRYSSARIYDDVRATAIDGTVLMKVEVDRPTDLWDIKDEMKTYEADLNYLDQVLLAKYPDKIPEFHPRIWYFDLEWDTKEDFTSVMAVVDSDLDTPVVFAWADERTNCDYLKAHTPSGKDWESPLGGSPFHNRRYRKVRDEKYNLRLYSSEADMHEGFINFLQERDPDILVAHALMWADLPHLMRRLNKPDQLSPLGQVIRPFKGRDGYKDTQQPIKGRLCWDSAAHWKSGSGFETLWQKSGRGQLPNRKLNTIAERLELGSKLTEEIEGMNVHNGWREYWTEFVDYCLLDTTLLRDIDNKLSATKFFVAVQQLCGVSWGSTHKVTRYFRGMVGRRTKLKAPSAHKVMRESLQAAHIPDPIAGRHEGVGIFDYASLYPNIILSDNLCYTTKRKSGGEGIKTLGNGTHWDQTKKGLLPAIVEEMLELRKEYKQKMKDATDPDEKLSFDMLQTAAKVLVNALYGMTGMKAIQGMWIDNDIASSITHRGREAIHHLLKESEEQGFKSLYGHTDSAFIQVPFNKAESLAGHLTKTAQEMLELPTMDVELEAYFDYWTTAPVKNRYFGIKVWPEKSKGEMKVTGYATKASSSSRITKQVQNTAMQLIATGKEEQEVTDALREISVTVRKGEIPIQDVYCSTRLSMDFKDYKTLPAVAKAALYYNEHVAQSKDEKYEKGESVSWIYVSGFKDEVEDYYTFNGEKRKVDFVAFRELEELNDYIIDWDKVLDVMVKSKLKRIYESVNWELNAAAGAVVPRDLFGDEENV